VRTARPHLPLRFRACAASAVALIALFLAPAVHAGRQPSLDSPSLDGNGRQAILDCTFEVLSHIREGHIRDGRIPDEHTRDKSASAPEAAPLVRVAGTAFCFGDGELATAAHVFDQVLGSRFDPPFVRDRAGNTYPVEKILRYSMRDDFVVFSVAGLPLKAARPHVTLESAGEKAAPLYLAWRKADGQIALERTAYRGRSTVETLGRDGWIAFGPAPDHGASGAALLDSAGRVIGLINSRSSERANALAYAVPIAIIDGASLEEADIAMRDPLRLLGMPSERNMPLVGGIPLPAPYERFNRHMAEVRRTYFAYTLPYSLSLSGVGAPMSDAERIHLCEALGPGYCDEQIKTRVVRKSLRRCSVRWSGVGAALVECRGESEGLPLTLASVGRRASQAAPAPCTPEDPLEDLRATDSFTDQTGTTWQTRSWSVRGCDWTVLSMSRSVPGGTLAFVRGAPSAYAEAASMQLKALTGIQCENCMAPKTADAVLAEARSTRSDVSR
jgi:hypothetical protein